MNGGGGGWGKLGPPRWERGWSWGATWGARVSAGKCREAVEIPSPLSGACPALLSFLPFFAGRRVSVIRPRRVSSEAGWRRSTAWSSIGIEVWFQSSCSVCGLGTRATLWALYSRLQKVRPPGPLLRVVVEVRWDDLGVFLDFEPRLRSREAARWQVLCSSPLSQDLRAEMYLCLQVTWVVALLGEKARVSGSGY